MATQIQETQTHVAYKNRMKYISKAQPILYTLCICIMYILHKQGDHGDDHRVSVIAVLDR